MHGKEKTRQVADSLRSAADWIERVVKEVGGLAGGRVWAGRRACSAWQGNVCLKLRGSASQASGAGNPKMKQRKRLLEISPP